MSPNEATLEEGLGTSLAKRLDNVRESTEHVSE